MWATFVPLAGVYLLGFIFIVNQEINTGMKIMTMNPPGN